MQCTLCNGPVPENAPDDFCSDDCFDKWLDMPFDLAAKLLDGHYTDQELAFYEEHGYWPWENTYGR